LKILGTIVHNEIRVACPENSYLKGKQPIAVPTKLNDFTVYMYYH